MLTIRGAQASSLGDPFRVPYRERLRRHVHETMPEVAAERGDEGVRALVGLAVMRAAQHGIESCRDVGLYLAFMVVLGDCFDTDPAHAWVIPILRDAEASGAEKVDRLLAAALAHGTAPGET
jgi:hypothetical protein